MSEDFKFKNLLTSVSVPDTSGKNIGTERAESKLKRIYFEGEIEGGKLLKLNIFPWTLESGVANAPVVKIKISESMLTGPMIGNIIVRDVDNMIDMFAFQGGEKLYIEFDIGKNEQNLVKLKFDVTSKELLTDVTNLQNNDSNDEKVLYYNFNFIGDGVVDAEFFEYDDPPDIGRFHDILKTIFEENKLKINEIDKSKTGIWNKESITAPWRNRTNRINFLQYVKYITKFAIYQDQETYRYDMPTFYTWEDRRGWSSLDVYKLTKKDPVDGFIITADQTHSNGIIKFEVISDFDYMGLLESGVNGFILPDELDLYTIGNPIRLFPNPKDDIYGTIFSDKAYPIWRDVGNLNFQNKDYYAYEEISGEYVDTIYEDPKGEKNYKVLDTRVPNNSKFDRSQNPLGYLKEEPYYVKTNNANSWDFYKNSVNGPWHPDSFVPAFDTTEIPFELFEHVYKIRKAISFDGYLYEDNVDYNLRESILEPKGFYDIRDYLPSIPDLRDDTIRYAYSVASDHKKAWNFYRCSICCHEFGALGSKEDIEILQNPGPIDGITYQDLFGPDGLYSKNDNQYQIVAAGSFTDTLNYDPGNTANQYGLTYSYDLTKSPYNETIGQFYNLKGPEAPLEYTKHVLDRSIGLYNILLSKIDKRLGDIQNFLGNVDSYKNTADSIFAQALIDKESPTHRPVDLSQGFRYVGDAFPGENLDPFIGSETRRWPILEQEYALVPYTAIPPSKGIGVVVFGSDTSGNAVTFRFTNELLGSFVCLGANGNPCNCSVVSDSIAECLDLGGTPYEGIASCDDVTPILEIANGCFRDYHYCTPFGNCVPASDNPESWSSIHNNLQECQEQCAGGNGNQLTLCCGGISTSNFTCELVPVNECDSPVLDCCDCDNNPDPTCNESGCPDDQILCCIRNGSFITCGCRTPEECQASTGSEVSNCSQCIPGSTGPTGPTGPSGLPTPEDIVYILPNLLQPCSTDPVMRGYIKYINATAAATFSPIYDYAAPYLWDDEDETLVRDWSFYDYGSEYGLIPGISDPNVTRTTRDCLNGNGCYNTTCLSANALEALRRTVVAESQLLSVEKELVTKLRDEVSSKFKNKWLSSYASWYQRNAFFFSKKPGSSIFRNEDEEFDGVNSELSLFNIKKITRKEIRGSRYELLSRAVGITGASAGEWLYDIYFGGDEGSTAHPYYDQGYTGSPFITSRAPHAWFGFSDSDATDDPSYYKDFINFNDRPYGPQYRGSEFQEPGLIHVNSATNNSTNMISGTPFTGNQLYGYAQHDLRGDVSTFKNTFNFYNLQNKKPSNVKKEEISSYVRIEFTTPIGLDKIKDFPNGFIRDAGVEYFLPYIVNITPGPMGRQSVKYNIAVIGMDPYGFDVAVKRIKDDLPTNRKLQGIDKGNYYKWWNHDTGMVLSKTEYLTPDYNGMDLWPEEIFETAYPYYAYDPSQEDLHGGGYDLDFHMGGGYYFENDSQDWMESLYHYGVSSGKQFDPLYRTSVLGSYILPNSYRKLKPHRSWWSLFVPRNLFIPIRFSNMLKSPNTKARDMFGGRAIFTINPNYWRTWYGSEFETWLSLENNGATRNLLTDNAPDLRFYIENVEGDSISAYAETTNAVQQYFHDSLMNYLAGDHIISQRLVDKEDLWKYDLSGETEYGLVTPPVDAEYDVFDRNFAAQFTVVGKPLNTCKDLGFSCADKTRTSLVPENVGECEKGITYAEYCGCKNYSLMPSVKEPTLLDLHRLKKLIKEAECYLLDKYPPYGKDSIGWIGCDYGYPDATWSCDCTQSEDELTEDDLNEKLDRMNVLSMVQRTYAMFWGIDQETYPNRTIFESNIKAQQIRITVPPNDKVNIGDMVEVLIPREDAGVATSERKFRKFSGKWLVAGIDHDFDGQFNYKLSLTLIRDSMPYENSPSSRRRYKYQEQLD